MTEELTATEKHDALEQAVKGRKHMIWGLPRSATEEMLIHLVQSSLEVPLELVQLLHSRQQGNPYGALILKDQPTPEVDQQIEGLEHRMQKKWGPDISIVQSRPLSERIRFRAQQRAPRDKEPGIEASCRHPERETP